jgi:uncharacterized protein (TIGR03083 family)
VKEPPPVLVADLFPEVLEALLGLLSGLAPEAWEAPTACAGWTVKDVALHLLGVDAGVLSRRRDGQRSGSAVDGWDELVALVNQWNEAWVQATRRLSPRLLIDLLEFVGGQACAYWRSLNPHSPGGPVSWAGPDPAPVWLDIAREYTERWHHQQHIREAVGKPGLDESRYLAPVLATFARALPQVYRGVRAGEGTLVALTIHGPAGGRWFARREGGDWRLYVEVEERPQAEAVLDEETAWRLFTRGLERGEAEKRVVLTGDRALATRMLEMVSIIA